MPSHINFGGVTPNNPRLFEDQLEGFRGAFAREVEDVGPERARLGAGISSMVASKAGRVGGSQQQRFAGGLTQLLQKAKVRTGIAKRGEKAIEGQRLKDRLTLARSAASRRGLALRGVDAARRTRLGLDTSLQASKDQVTSSLFGVAGGIAGGLAASIKERMKRNQIDQDLAPLFEPGSGTF